MLFVTVAVLVVVAVASAVAMWKAARRVCADLDWSDLT